MKKLGFYCLFLLLSGCLSKPFPFTRTPQAVERISHAVAALVAPVPGSPVGAQRIYCTGSFISRSEVLTAAHCVTNRVSSTSTVFEEVHIGTYQDYIDTAGVFQDRRWHRFIVSSLDESNDLALLTLAPGESSLFLHGTVDLSPVPALPGENVIVLGHPAGLGWSLTSGVVSNAVRQANPGDGSVLYIQHSAQVYFGNSGGPVFNSRNEIVGVVSRAGPWHVGLSIHLTVVREFILRYRLRTALS